MLYLSASVSKHLLNLIKHKGVVYTKHLQWIESILLNGAWLGVVTRGSPPGLRTQLKGVGEILHTGLQVINR